MYNFTEYSDNYSDTSGNLWQFNRDELPVNNEDLAIINSQSFKYKAAFVGKTADINNGNGFVKNTKIIFPLKYLNNFWKSLEMPLINYKNHLYLNWIEDCILSSAGDTAKFKWTDSKLHVRIVTLSTKNNVNLTKHLSDAFKRSVYWSYYETINAKGINNEINIYGLLSTSFQGVKRLFVLAYDATDNNEAIIKTNKKYFYLQAKIESYNVLIHERNFYDQPTNDLIKQYYEVRKVATGQGDDDTTKCLLDYTYFRDNCRLIPMDLNKKKT